MKKNYLNELFTPILGYHFMFSNIYWFIGINYFIYSFLIHFMKQNAKQRRLTIGKKTIIILSGVSGKRFNAGQTITTCEPETFRCTRSLVATQCGQVTNVTTPLGTCR
jgi:hypothetical protein